MARLSGFHLEGGIDKTMLDLVRPVNSLYLTVGSEDPNTVFGGTWVKLTGGVLACAGTAGYAAAGAVGGSKKISVGQMPSHIHSGTRSVTTTLRENVEGSENFALSGVVEDSLYTFDAWTNATGGGGLLPAPHLRQRLEEDGVARGWAHDRPLIQPERR